MNFNRRQLLAGAAALAISPQERASAYLHPGAANGYPIGHGWNTLPLGAGGLVTGFDIAADNSIVCRTDVGNIYRWTGKTTTTTNPSDQWLPLLNVSSLSAISANPTNSIEWGSLEIVQAPSDATKIWSVFNALTTNTGALYYSTNSGVTWNLTNLTSIAGWEPNTPAVTSKRAFHIIMVDPSNPLVVYAGFWVSSGLTYPVYVATDGHTFSGVSTLGTTTAGTVAVGMCFDASSGTVTGIGGLTVTARALIPVSGGDVYETVDGGVTWATTGAATAFGTSSFYINCGVINSNGVYYVVVNNVGVFRYKNSSGTPGGGTWTNAHSAVTPGSSTYLIIDPADPTYLSQTGERGCVYGYTSLNADTGSPPTWTASAGSVGFGGSTANVASPSYDLPWMTDIFNQGLTNYGLDISCAKIDSAGNTILSGNQSIWILPGRLVYNGPTNYTYTSFGRGQNATVAQEVWKPTGGTYPLIAVQDFGTPIGGTFVTFPTAYAPPYSEYTCSSIEESPTDGTFCVFRITGQGGNPAEAADASGYSTDASANVTAYAANPSAAWRGTIHGTVTSYNSSLGTATLTVTSQDTGVIFIGQQVFDGSTNRGVIASGSAGTYTVSFATGNDAGPTLQLYADNIAGQIIAVDNNNHLIVAAGHSHGCIPIHTGDQGATWALCGGLPSSNWLRGAWFGAPTSKPLAVGFGTDVGTAWAAIYSGTTVTFYKSTDSGANFTQVSTQTVGASMTSLWLVAVPGQLGHLWFSGTRAGALYRSTDYGATWSTATLPSANYSGFNLNSYLSIGAIDPVSGTYPTLWLTAGNSGDPTQQSALFYSINGATSWTALGSHGLSGIKPDLPVGQQMYGLNSVRADRQIFKRLYCGGGQMGFAYYNP